MGIDVYMRWPGQTRAEEKAQITGYSAAHGHVGYLREAYHGGPYVTKFLVEEAFADDAKIPAAKLRERLPAAVFLALFRHETLYGEKVAPDIIEIDKGAGGVIEAIAKALGEAKRDGRDEQQMAAHLTAEQLRATTALIERGALPYYAKAFVDFVILAERKEAETGEPVTIIVSG